MRGARRRTGIRSGRGLGRELPRCDRAPRRRADARRTSRTRFARVRADVARLQRAGRRGEARGHAGLRAARRRRGRGARTRRRPASRRALDGRDGRSGDGGRWRRLPTAGSRCIAPLGLWLDEHPDHRHLLAAAVRVPAAAVPRRGRGHGVDGRAGSTSTTPRRSRRSSSRTAAGSAPPARCCSRSPTGKLASACTASPTRPCSCGATTTGTCLAPYADAWQRAVEGADLEIIPDAGHMAPYERPADVAGVIARFFGV